MHFLRNPFLSRHYTHKDTNTRTKHTQRKKKKKNFLLYKYFLLTYKEHAGTTLLTRVETYLYTPLHTLQQTSWVVGDFRQKARTQTPFPSSPLPHPTPHLVTYEAELNLSKFLAINPSLFLSSARLSYDRWRGSLWCRNDRLQQSWARPRASSLPPPQPSPALHPPPDYPGKTPQTGSGVPEGLANNPPKRKLIRLHLIMRMPSQPFKQHPGIARLFIDLRSTCVHVASHLWIKHFKKNNLLSLPLTILQVLQKMSQWMATVRDAVDEVLFN